MATRNPDDSHLQAWIRYSDVFGERPSFDDLISRMRRFSADQLLHVLSKLSVLMDNVGFDSPALQQRVERAFLSAADRILLERKRREEGDGFFLHPLQIWNLMKNTILHGDRDRGAAIECDDSRHEVGRLLLLQSEFLEVTDDEMDSRSRPELEALISEVAVRSQSLHVMEPAGNLLARYWWLFLGEGSDEPIDTGPPPGELFQGTYGISLSEFSAVSMGLLMQWRNINLSSGADLSSMLRANVQAAFGQTLIPPDSIGRVLGLLSCSFEEYREYLRAEVAGLERHEPWAYSMLTLRRFPLVSLGDHGLLPLSLQLLTERSTAGLYWLIADALPKEKRKGFFRWFGQRFEEHVRRVLRHAVPGSCRHIRYGSSEREACDALLLFADNVVIVEAKSGRLRLVTERSGGRRDFSRDLGKVVYPAVGQLDRVIEDIRAGRLEKEGVSSTVRRFYPVLVTLRGIPTNPLAMQEIDQYAIREGFLQGQDVERVTIVDASELEAWEGDIAAGRMLRQIRERNGDEGLRRIPFSNFIVGKNPERRKKVSDGLYISELREAAFNTMARTAFGRGLPNRGRGPGPLD